MKKVIITSLAILSSFSAVAHAECTQANNVAVDYALAYLSLVEQGGWGYNDPVIPQLNRSSQELCALLVNSQVQASSREGYTDVSLELEDESCTVTMKLTSTNRIEKMSLVSCTHK